MPGFKAEIEDNGEYHTVKRAEMRKKFVVKPF
jgi:hypothetical protein